MIRLNHVFLVTKGADNIRMVNNGNSSGTNDIFWDPKFYMTIVRNNLREIEEWMFISERYVGKNT